jgi:hypothetical protein
MGRRSHGSTISTMLSNARNERFRSFLIVRMCPGVVGLLRKALLVKLRWTKQARDTAIE